VAREGDLGARGEDAQARERPRAGRRVDEHRFGQVEFARDGLQRDRVGIPGLGEHSKLVPAEGDLGEDVGQDETQAHDLPRRGRPRAPRKCPDGLGPDSVAAPPGANNA
jgi:hypothetical protein